MSMKWLETSILHEANIEGPGDGGGHGDSGSVSDGSDDGGGDAAPESSTRSDDGGGEPAAPEPAKATPVDDGSTPIQFPNALANIFASRPSEPGPPSTTRTPAPEVASAPAAGPSKPDYSLAVTDPEVFAKQLDAYYEARLEAVKSEGIKPVEDLKQELQRERQEHWQGEFRRAAIATNESMKRHWENVLSKDPDFRANKDLQGAVQDIIGFFVDGAKERGDIASLRLAQDPKFYRRALIIAKDELDMGRAKHYRPGEGPSMAGPQGRQSAGPRVVDADTEAAIAEAAREGYHYTPEQIAKALKARGR